MLWGMLDRFHMFRRWCTATGLCPALAFLTLSVVLYSNTLGGEFVYDDAFFYQNSALRSWNYLWDVWWHPSLNRLTSNAHYRPLTFASFALNYLLFGASPFSFHAASIALNGLACWLLFLVTRRLFGNSTLAWMTALCFAFFPIHTESVAYLKARDELLVAVFGFAAWLCFLHACAARGRWRTAQSLTAGVLALCAFLSKESALVLPGVFAGSVWLLQGWRGLRAALVPTAAQAGAIGIFFALHHIAVGNTFVPGIEILYFGQNPLGYVSPELVPWTAMQLFFLSVGLTYVPWNLSATYGFAHIPLIDAPWGSWMSIAGIALVLTAVVTLAWPRARRSPAGIGVLTFLVLYFPFSKIPFYHSIDFFAERWLYAPSAGLAMIGGFAALQLWNRWRQVAPTVFTAIIVAYIFVLVPRNMVWRNETALGESMVRNAPLAVTGYVLLGNNRLQYGRLEEATALVTQGLAITRNHLPIHHVAAAVAIGTGRLNIAEQAVSTAEAMGGDELANIILRSTLLAKQHKYQESLDHLRQSRWFEPTEHRTRMLLALNLWMLDRHSEAEEYFDWDAHLPTVKMDINQKIYMFETY